MRNKNAFSTLLAVLITAVVVGVLVGVFSYSYAASKKDLEIEGLKEQLSQAKREGVDEMGDWETYTNNKYGYSFKYPEKLKVVSDGMSIAEETTDLKVFDPDHYSATKSTFNVRVQDPGPNAPMEIQANMSLGLKEFTEKVWKLNKDDNNPNFPNRKVGDIDTITVDRKKAYQFTTTDSFNDPSGGHVVDGEHLFIFIENEGEKFIIYFSSADTISNQILSTFQFTK